LALENSVEVYGIRETLAEIRDVDKNLFFAIRAYMKRAGDTLGNRVLSNSPILGPTRGFRNHSGRTAWKPGTFKTEVSGRNAKKGITGATPLLRVKFGGVAYNIADMAGRGGGRSKRSRTRSYQWQGTRRTHAVTTQGQQMIAALGKSPSRYIWAEAENALPMIQNNVLLGVEQYMSNVNRKFEVINRSS
jgi:hypothetical protein